MTVYLQMDCMRRLAKVILLTLKNEAIIEHDEIIFISIMQVNFST